MTKERVEVAFIAPADGRLQAGRGGKVAREDSEGLADEPVGGPARQRDAPAGTADPGQLGRGPVVVGGEHDPVDREHGVEGGVGKAKVFCVTLDEPDVEMFGRGADPTALEQRRDVVDADGLAAPPCRRDRGIAAPGGDVEHTPPGLEVRGLTQMLGLEDDPRGDDGEISARPGFLLPALHRGEVGSNAGIGIDCGAHGLGPPGFRGAADKKHDRSFS